MFAKAVVPRLEALPYLYRYAWFEARAAVAKGGVGAAGETLLVTPQNATPPVALTALGEWYNGFVP